MSRIRKSTIIHDAIVLALGFVVGFVIVSLNAGCATAPSPGWHPQSENEMRILVGQTVFMAMDQYQDYLRAVAELEIQDSLKGQDDADKPIS